MPCCCRGRGNPKPDVRRAERGETMEDSIPGECDASVSGDARDGSSVGGEGETGREGRNVVVAFTIYRHRRHLA